MFHNHRSFYFECVSQGPNCRMVRIDKLRHHPW